MATTKPSSAPPLKTLGSTVLDPLPPAREESPLADARRLGEAEAEIADLNLRVKESLTRERRLLETTIELQEALEQAGRLEHEMRLQLERYAARHQAVEASSAWRLVQFLRSLVGRKW